MRPTSILCSQARILTRWEFPESHNLNFSNRLVRTRMPGGVGRVGLRRPYPDQRQRQERMVWRLECLTIHSD
jgi:hypothetical protein